MDSTTSVPSQRTDPGDRDASAYPDRGSMDRNGAEGPDDTCKRISGTQPRNRQARMLEYYFGREHICLSVNQTAPVKIFDRNPYRTQLAFAIKCSDLQGPAVVNLAHTQDDATNHAVFRFRLNDDAKVGGPFDWNRVFSFPLHGPMVCEEWWIRTTGIAPGTGICTVDATGYLYSD